MHEALTSTNDKWEASNIDVSVGIAISCAIPRETRRNGKPPLQVNPTASAIRVNQSPTWGNDARTPFAVEGTPRITNDTSARARWAGARSTGELTNKKQTVDLLISRGNPHSRARFAAFSNEALARTSASISLGSARLICDKRERFRSVISKRRLPKQVC